MRKLLSELNSNPKVAKNEKKLGISTAVMHLAPGDMSGFEVCQYRSPGCTAACLHYAGAAYLQTTKDKARIARTQFFFKDRDTFLTQLVTEIRAHIRQATKRGLIPAVRLNGTSDLPWERIRHSEGWTILDRYPDTMFYDYTAVPNRKVPDNYHLTFSLKENNLEIALASGMNIAAVFFGDMPTTYLGLPVIDGDEHDYRPADPTRCIVGLKAKGSKGKADTSGFVSRTDDLAMAA